MFDDDTKSEKKSGGMTEIARKVLLTGLGAIFMTEEGIRRTLGDLKIPKDAISALLETVKRQKNDVLSAVATELGNFLSKVKVHEELRKALTGLQLHLDAKLTFDPHKKDSEHTPKLTLKKK